MEHIKIYPWQY